MSNLAPMAAPTQCLTLVSGVTLMCDIAGCLFWPEESLLVVSDLHLEKGASFASRGSMIPPYDTAVTLGALAARIAWWKPRRIISLGDSFHDGRVSGRMPEVFRMRLEAMMAGREWIWVSGNHDPEPPQGIGGDFADEIVIGQLTFRHAPAQRFAVGEISGHLHPEARVVRRGKAVRRKCFATDGARLVMPAFGAYTGGLNVRDRAFTGLFEEESLCAHLIGRDRMYTIAGRDLV
ncbi:MAG TPA: ligase-associated DNA damage response endonuclease PdeM [Rhizobiaceae bacterium]|nr:ligase-associated DNA damage response endonuclease PdeM [Rhizobiaceae bacterium]